MPNKIDQITGMPQMSAAFSNWKIGLLLKRISQTTVNGLIVDAEETIHAKGTWQPLSAEEIALKPEGQRAWSWWDVHIEGSEVLFLVNDRVVYRNETYKIMAVKDYTLNNYSEYHVILDYQEQ